MVRLWSFVFFNGNQKLKKNYASCIALAQYKDLFGRKSLQLRLLWWSGFSGGAEAVLKNI
jgi:hypothetical protein